MNPDPTSTLRTRINGHSFHKSSDCPVCPVCESIAKPTDGFLSLLAAPARRALVNEGITSLEKLAGYTQK
jgi:predicted RecB family nuclease